MDKTNKELNFFSEFECSTIYFISICLLDVHNSFFIIYFSLKIFKTFLEKKRNIKCLKKLLNEFIWKDKKLLEKNYEIVQ